MTLLETPTDTDTDAFDEAVWCFEYNIAFVRSLTDVELGEATTLINAWRLGSVWFNAGDQYIPHLIELLGWSDDMNARPYPLNPTAETILDGSPEDAVEFVLYDCDLDTPTNDQVAFLERLAVKLHEECSRIKTHYYRTSNV